MGDGEFEGDALQRMMGGDGFSPDLPARPGGKSAPLALRLLMYMLSGLRIGSLEVSLPNGAVRRFNGSQPGPHGVWHIRSAGLIRHVLAAGEVGTMGYLNRIGFFDHLLSGVEVLPFRPFRSGARTFRGGNTGVVEIARIDPGYRESSRNIHNTLAAALVGAYRGDEDRNVLWGATWTIFSELIDNIYSHSATPLDGYAALQVYPGAKKATVTVSDSGYGIMHTLRGSLKTKFPHLVDLSDSQLLLEIFQHGGVSRHGPQNGLGLHGSAQKAMKFHADLDVRLPNSRVHLKPNVQGYNKLAYWSDGLPLLWGTHISFDFRLDATH